jgi:hypothetical protein
MHHCEIIAIDAEQSHEFSAKAGIIVAGTAWLGFEELFRSAGYGEGHLS